MKFGIFKKAQRWTGLFADYVNTWLKLKQESAGWPSWCQTVAKKGLHSSLPGAGGDPRS